MTMASTRALMLLALLRAAAPVDAADASSSALRGSRPAAASTASGRFFAVTNPPRGGGRSLAANSSQTFHPVEAGDHECEGDMRPIESLEDCAAAAQVLWPTGFQAPCLNPVWADNILVTDEPHEPYGCLVLQSPDSHGCGLRWNPTGHEHDCVEPGLTCAVVCSEADESEADESEADEGHGNETARGLQQQRSPMMCKGIRADCWVDAECCSGSCGWTRRCRAVR